MRLLILLLTVNARCHASTSSSYHARRLGLMVWLAGNLQSVPF